MTNDLVETILNNMGWIVAAIPLIACFISNWVTVGTSAYFRLHPAVCIAPLPTLITQALTVSAIVLFLLMPIVVSCGSFVPVHILLGSLSLLGIHRVLNLMRGEYSQRFEGLLGYLFIGFTTFWLATILVFDCVPKIGPLWWAPITDPQSGFERFLYFLTARQPIGNIVVVNIADLIAFLTLLCVVAFLAGVYYAAHREPRLVDMKDLRVVLSVFTGGVCGVATIELVEYVQGKKYPVCHISKQRSYPPLTEMGDSLCWVRFAEIKVDRENATLPLRP